MPFQLLGLNWEKQLQSDHRTVESKLSTRENVFEFVCFEEVLRFLRNLKHEQMFTAPTRQGEGSNEGRP